MAVHSWAMDFDLRILWGIAGGVVPIGFLSSLAFPPKTGKSVHARKEA